jgi:hypothetical protein
MRCRSADPPRRVWLAGLALVACAPGGRAQPAPWVVVPAEARFEAPRWQALAVLGLTVENQGFAEANLRLQAAAPLQADTAGLRLGPGQAAEIVISWTPEGFDPLQASLAWSWEGGSAFTRVEGCVPRDADGDGYLHPQAGGQDCDDQDDRVFPGADDPPGGADQDCDGQP